MNTNLLTIIAIIFSGILFVEILQYISLKKNSKEIGRLSEKHYFDLNLKFQSLKAIMIMASITLVFLGWNTISKISEEVKNSVSPDVEIIKSELDTLKNYQKTYKSDFKDIEINLNETRNKYLETENKLESLNDEFEKRIANVKTLLSIYIVPDISIDPKSKDKRIYYSELKPINSEHLPKFKNPPFVNIQSTTGGLWLSIREETKDYIDIDIIGSSGNKFEITLWIVER